MWLSYVILLTALTSHLSAQSVDEESYVQLTEGSGRFSSDDEDIEGSALPKDTNYATTPVVRPRFTQGPITRLITNTVKYPTILQTQRVTTYATSTPHADIDPSRGEDTNSREMLSSNTTIIVLIVGILVVVAIAVILISFCFRHRTGRSSGYTPGQHRSSAALLNTQ